MERGYVRSYRKKIHSDLWMHHNAYRVFEFLLHSAMYRPHKYFTVGACIDLQPGDYVSSIRQIAEKCDISDRETRTSLMYLKSTQRIAQQTTHKYSVFSIINWDKYQNPDGSNDTADDTLNDTVATQYRHSSDTVATQEVEVKNVIKKERKKKPTSFALPDAIRPEVWDAFEEHRKVKRSPLTDHARQLTVNACAKIGGDPNELIEHAILRGWKTVFPIDGGRNGSGNQGVYGSSAQVGNVKARPGKYAGIGTSVCTDTPDCGTDPKAPPGDSRESGSAEKVS